MLKGYASYDWHESLAEQGVSYVTRMRDNAKFEVRASHTIEADSGILRDETINYTSLRSSKKQLTPVRRIVFHDAELDKDYVFTTNRFDWSQACWRCNSALRAAVGGSVSQPGALADTHRLTFESQAPLPPHRRRETRSHCKGDSARPEWNCYSIDRYVPAQQKPR